MTTPQRGIMTLTLLILLSGFLLIAMLGGAWAMPGEAVTWIDPVLAFFHILAGFIWAVFHILVIVLQAFIFVALAFVYIGQAHSSH